MPPAPCGAVERVWDGFAHVFARRGHRVTVLCQGHPDQRPDEIKDGVRYIRRTHFSRPKSTALSLIKDGLYSAHMFAHLPEADFLVTNTFWMPFLLSWWNPSAGRIAVHVARMPKKQYWLYPAVHRFQAVSTVIQEAIVAQVPRFRDRVRMLPNPVHDRFFGPARHENRKVGAGTVLFTGRIHPEKGLDVLVAAFGLITSKFPDLKLRIVGPWRTEQGGAGAEYRDNLRTKAKGLPVEFEEPVFDLDQLAAVYRSADYYCYPSLAEMGEASPIAPLEAMASGMVPIVSDLRCFSDYIENGRTGMVFDHRATDPINSLSAAIQELVTNPEATVRVGAAAAARAAKLSYDRVADLYLDDFDEMLRKGGRSRWTVSSRDAKP
ncbi:MAG TPA: glycosyltransferase family 4 protein [Gemmata sp.]|nr:glycosyltransferase family 4 protein [Gemmata sp.]